NGLLERYLAAQSIAEHRVQSAPTDVNELGPLALIELRLANLYEDLGRRDDAKRAADRGSDIAEGLAAQTGSQYWNEVASAFNR
ncbi:hypothetical protein ABTL52_20320, partial [Acinetobacter baumannii]